MTFDVTLLTDNRWRSMSGIAFILLLWQTWSGHVAGAQVPVVFRVSEGVRPNAIISLYGEYLTDSPSVRFLRSDDSVAATQSSVQTDPGGHFCRVVFPSIAPGAYKLSVQNAAGWSTQPAFVNRAEPRWISEERAYSGLQLKLIGRNLDAREYGGSPSTHIRLVPTGGGQVVVVTPDLVTPYCVDFSIPSGVALGSYYVEVNADSTQYGRDWIRLNNHSEYPDAVRDTVVRVESVPTDPIALALKVAWANDFIWSRIADAKTQFGARGDGAADDTRAIQNALDDLSKSGGGVAFLPKEVYRVSSLVLGSKCILQGEGREETVVMVAKAGDDGAIIAKGDTQGVSTMTLEYQASVAASSQGMLLAGTTSKLFIYNTKFDLLRSPDISVKESPYYFSGDGPMLIAHSQFYLSSRNLWDHAVRNHVTFRDNFIDMHDGLGLCMSSEKLLVLNNELVFHPADYAGQMNGFFLNKGWMGWNIFNAYIAGNNAHNLNGPGDCQPFAADSAWSCFAGAVVDSSANTVDVRNDLSADFKGLDTHETELITGPPGVGKTHLSIALDREACKRGYAVRFFTAAELVHTYLEARQEKTVLKLESQIRHSDLVLIDELGYVPFDRMGAEHLFGFFSQCYEQTSLIVTTNLPFVEWPQVFAGDERLTGALLDRLTHHVLVIEILSDSYRLNASLKRKKKSG